MKIAVNKEYALRHGGVAALLFGLGMWFLYDAIFVYPYLKPEDGHHTSLEFQYSMAGILTFVAIVVAIRLFNSFKSTLEWDDTAMWGSVTKGNKISFADIDRCDKRQWESKGIIVVYTKDGKHFVFDSWHHTGVNELVEKFPSNQDNTAEA